MAASGKTKSSRMLQAVRDQYR